MYNTALVDTICRRYQEENSGPRQGQLLDFLEVVVLEDQPGIREHLTELIDIVSTRELEQAN